jgi:hypothetical protein
MKKTGAAHDTWSNGRSTNCGIQLYGNLQIASGFEDVAQILK